jgi:hypothetical protein
MPWCICDETKYFMTTIASGKFNTNCEVDYSTAHVLSYLVVGMNALNFIIVSGSFFSKKKIFSLRNPQRK